MKVKEALCNIFKEDLEIETLKENEDYKLVEEINRPSDLRYSSYILTNKKTDSRIMSIRIPDPRMYENQKDLFLKYQHGARKFFEAFFDVIIGQKEDIKPMYKTKQKKDLFYKESTYKDGTPIVFICAPETENQAKFIGSVTFPSQEKNLKIADSFIKLFEGIPIESSWREICEQ